MTTATKINLESLQNEFQILTLPGMGNSGDLHWQTYWEAAFPLIGRIEQENWDTPERDQWLKTIEQKLSEAEKPVIVVAHSLGCIAMIHLANANALKNVVGLILVAVPDVEREDFNEPVTGFTPVPNVSFQVPTLMIGSSNDPFITVERNEKIADDTNAQFKNVGEQLHIGSDAELGFWFEGQNITSDFIKKNILNK